MLEQKEFKINALKDRFRIAEMNAIDVLALQTQISLDIKTGNLKKSYETILESIEVFCAGQWLPVKEKGSKIYFPAKIDDNIQAIKELTGYFMNDYLAAVFPSSNG